VQKRLTARVRGSSDGRGEHDLAERVTAIDEEPATLNEGARKPMQRTRTRVQLSPIERPDPYSERQVVRLLLKSEDQFLARDSSDAQHASLDQIAG
jgi:hypothetical protein